MPGIAMVANRGGMVPVITGELVMPQIFDPRFGQGRIQRVNKQAIKFAAEATLRWFEKNRLKAKFHPGAQKPYIKHQRSQRTMARKRQQKDWRRRALLVRTGKTRERMLREKGKFRKPSSASSLVFLLVKKFKDGFRKGKANTSVQDMIEELAMWLPKDEQMGAKVFGKAWQKHMRDNLSKRAKTKLARQGLAI